MKLKYSKLTLFSSFNLRAREGPSILAMMYFSEDVLGGEADNAPNICRVESGA